MSEEKTLEQEAGSRVEVAVGDGLPEYRELTPEEATHFRGLIEAVIFASPEPVTVANLAARVTLDKVNVRTIADGLMDDFSERDGGILLREISGGYQFVTSDRFSTQMRQLQQDSKKEKLTRSAMETLAIISYRQPITLPEIEEVRGAASRPHIVTLLTKRLIKPQGTRPVPGRPTLYVTTKNFLNHFALNSLSDLPPLEEVKELKFDEIE